MAAAEQVPKLTGPVVDEAHLFGLLARCQSLGLRVVEMRPVPE